MSRIAILGSRGYPSSYGGFETLVRRLAPYLATRGHEVVVYGRERTLRSSKQIIDGVEVRNTPEIDFKSTSTLTAGLSASIDLARNPCDVALVLNVANGLYLRRLSRAGIATCVNVDGLEWDRDKWGSVARGVFLHAAATTARDADLIVFDSKALAGIWSAQFSRDGEYIPYGAELLSGYGTSRLQQQGIPTGGYVLAVARIVPENNVDLLLDALGYLPDSTRVVVVGESNYDHPTPRRLHGLEAEGRLRWLGHVDDQELLNELWVNAGAYWHGHSVGGTNPALLQALGAGAPTIALNTPFNREVVGRADQLVPSDASALAARIAAILDSPSLAQSLRESGRAIVRDRYSWESVCARYEAVLEQLADERRRAAIGRGARGSTRSATVQIRHAHRRPHRRRGRVVVVAGPDGAGKSTLATALQGALSARLEAAVPIVVNFRSRYIDRVLRRRAYPLSQPHRVAHPHDTPDRGAVNASAKAVALWADLVLSARAWRRRDEHAITLVERYAYDLVVDPSRLGVTCAPKRLRELAVRLSPSPDVIVMCTAPAGVLHARKGELDEQEIERQYAVWHRLREAIDVPVIDVATTEPVDADQLAARILATLVR